MHAYASFPRTLCKFYITRTIPSACLSSVFWVGSVIPYSGITAYSVASQQIRQKTVFFQIVEFYVILSCRCCSVWLQSTVLSVFECCLSNNIFRILVDSGPGRASPYPATTHSSRRGAARHLVIHNTHHHTINTKNCSPRPFFIR